MNKLTEIFLGQLLSPIIVAVLLPSILSVISKSKTGTWLSLINNIPHFWTIFLIIILIWISIILIRKRIKKIRLANYSEQESLITFIPRYGYVEIGEIMLYDMYWRVQVPAPSPYWSRDYSSPTLDDIQPDKIQIRIPPRCPKCKTELEQTLSFWGNNKVLCVNCGFVKKQKESFYNQSIRVKKIVKRDLELNQENQNPHS